jgi:hypothetical protein
MQATPPRRKGKRAISREFETAAGRPLTVGRRLRCAASSCIDSVDHDHDGKTNDDDVGTVVVL